MDEFFIVVTYDSGKAGKIQDVEHFESITELLEALKEKFRTKDVFAVHRLGECVADFS